MVKQKLLLIFEFYKSTLKFNVYFCIIPFILGGIDTFYFIFTTIGFFLSILLLDLKHKNEYIYYYNCGINKTKLIIFSFILNLIVSLPIFFIIALITYEFK
jgi:hypothetical protein